MPPDASSDSDSAVCRCGHAVGHPLVIGEARYSLFHYCLGLFMGSSAGDPKSVVFTCALCGDVVAESTDRAVIMAHRN